MDHLRFDLNPADYCIPNREQLAELRIWDLHYHGFLPGVAFAPEDFLDQHSEVLRYADRMGIERLVALDVGGFWRAPLDASPQDDAQRKYLEANRDRMFGIIRIDPSDPDGSLEKMERWIRHGPCVGIKHVSRFNRAVTNCAHPNNDPIMRVVRDLGAVVYVCTWLEVGGPSGRRFPGGANKPSQSTPAHVAQLAQRFPDIPIVCGHSGGDWELAARTVRPYKNVLFEFAGSDPHSGSVEYAVGELGIDRLVWGGHGPTRSYATEIAKVLDADLSKSDQVKIFGGNLRRSYAGILRSKGAPFEV